MRSRQEGTPRDGSCDVGRGDRQTPHELDALGSRLHRDARRLAARYQAAAPRIVAPAAAAPYRGLTIVAMAVAAAVIGMLSPMFSDNGTRRNDPDRWVSRLAAPAGRAEIPEVSGEVAGPPSSDLASTPPAGRERPLDSPAELDPQSFLRQVSDPELEALLDLWEEQRSEPTRLSI